MLLLVNQEITTMPKLIDTVLDPRKTASNFHFTGQKVTELTESEYTLVGLAVDTSTSTAGFKKALDESYGIVIKGCRLSPRASNLLLRTTEFNDRVIEKHGFVPLTSLQEDGMDFRCRGSTSLLDAILDQIEAIALYGKDLAARDRFANALIVIVTDGQENRSSVANEAKILAAIEKIRKDEILESLKIVLIGLGADNSPDKPILEKLKNDTNLDQFLWVGEATPRKLARVGDFVSRSISAASQSLGTGGPSKNLTI